MKYSFNLIEEASAVLPPREKMILESGEGESARHIALKILAYVLFRGQAAPLPLRIEQDVDQRHKPDLVAADPVTGKTALWIDCGQIEPKRLGRIANVNAGARIVVLKATDAEARVYARAAFRELPYERRGNIRYLGFTDGFLDAFTDALRGANTLTIALDDDSLSVDMNGAALSTEIRPFSPME